MALPPIGSQAYYDAFRDNCRRIRQIRKELVDFAQTHHDKADIENAAVKAIKYAGGEPGFMKVPGYAWATCISVNDEVVHGIPEGSFSEGDLVSIDTGMYKDGTTSDAATSFVIGPAAPDQTHFLNVGRKALKKTINLVKPGRRIKDLAGSMQTIVEKAGFSVVRNLTGHGLGRTMHEAPAIPCFLSSDPVLRTKLVPGMIIALEIMYTAGTWRTTTDKNGWTMRTADGSLAGHFEEDVLITPSGHEVLTDPNV